MGVLLIPYLWHILKGKLSPSVVAEAEKPLGVAWNQPSKSDKNQFNSTIQSNNNDFNNNTFDNVNVEINVCDADTENNIPLHNVTDMNSVVHANNMQMFDNPTAINDNISSRLRSSGESDGRSL